MNEDAVLTLTCPHCNKPLRALAEYAGGQVRCPHPDCQQPIPVPVPLSLDDEEESDLPTVLPEPPTPQPVAAEARPAKPPRKRRSADEDEPEPPARAAVLPWAFATAAVLVAAVAVAGWAVTVARDKPDEAAGERIATLEAKNRELQTENQKLRGQLNPPKTAPKDKRADRLSRRPTAGRTGQPAAPPAGQARADRRVPTGVSRPAPGSRPVPPGFSRSAPEAAGVPAAALPRPAARVRRSQAARGGRQPPSSSVRG